MTDERALLARHQAVLPKWMALYYDAPIQLTHGEGRHVWDAAGTKYLDWFGGILTTSTAHALPEVVTAVQEQAARMLHSSTLYLIEQQVELAEEIARLSGIPDAKVFFTGSGSEANEAALLLATGRRRSNQVLALRNSYHGRTFATVALTGNRGWRASQLSPITVNWVHGGYQYRSPWRNASPDEFIAHCVDDLKSVLQTTTSGDIAAMIFEPIQGVGGFATPPDGLFAAFQEVLSEEGILMIADEVQTGWGRTGEHFWGHQAHGIVPDVITFAKGIGNGLSVGGVIASAELMDSVTSGSISTFGGNPLAMAGSVANLKYILDHDLQGNAGTQGATIMHALREHVTAGHLPMVAELRGKGLMFALELVEPGTDTPDATAAGMMMEATKQRGLLIGKGGLYGNVLRMAPPMTLTAAESAEGAALLLEALFEVQHELHGIGAPTTMGPAEPTPSVQVNA
ncbi:MAG: aspartate aminotransferase family protein [Thermoleophilia bacterium]|nr:aspartate aminotransferase family protein [Thermoleophilia bacterium]